MYFNHTHPHLLSCWFPSKLPFYKYYYCLDSTYEQNTKAKANSEV
jgi:hypothetical protein